MQTSVECISSENPITPEQLEKQIQDSKALGLLLDRTLQSAALDIERECRLIPVYLKDHILEIADVNRKLEEDLSKV